MKPPELRRTAGPRLRLEGSQCPYCEGIMFPARMVCPGCGRVLAENLKAAVKETSKSDQPPTDFLFATAAQLVAQEAGND